MFQEDGGRPGDQRGFVHKKLLGLVSKVSGFVPGGELVSQITGRLAARRPSRPTLSRSLTARPTVSGERAKQLGREVKFADLGGVPRLTGPSFADARRRSIVAPSTTAVSRLHDAGAGPCMPPLIRSPQGNCIAPTSPRGAELFVGEATMGRYGAALIPGSQIIDRAVCLPGMQLGDDGLCYNKAAITNKERMWPRGRRPLLTGGDMNAIAIAARAGAKLDRTTKRLRSLGMMKRLPAPRKAAAHAHAKPVAAVSVT